MTAPFTLSYALASSLYGRLPLADVVPAARAVGDGRLDLWPQAHADQREQADALGRARFQALLETHDVQLALTTRYDLGPFGLREEFQYVASFGGSLVVSGSQKGGKDLQGQELKHAVATFVERMKPEVEAAAAQGITIGIENHASALLNSVDSILWFAESSPSPALGLALAPYHLPDDAALIARLIRDLGDRLALFYAWQHGMGCMEKLPKAQELRQLPGRGTMDFQPILRALHDIAYDRLVEVFMHPVPRGIPIMDEARSTTRLIRDARRYLDDRVARLDDAGKIAA